MKKSTLAVLLFFAMNLFNTVMAQPKKYTWDPVHANINFAVDYLKFSETTGRFTKSSGSFEFTKPDFSDAKVVVEAEAQSVNTDNPDRDGHLKSPDFFDVANFPSIKFVSTSFKKIKGNSYRVNGQLSLKGVTKNVTATAIYLGENTDAYGQTHAMWKVSFKINRQEYGVSFNKSNAVGDAVVGDEVRMTINAQFILNK